MQMVQEIENKELIENSKDILKMARYLDIFTIVYLLIMLIMFIY